jgi:hypothetical protein
VDDGANRPITKGYTLTHPAAVRASEICDNIYQTGEFPLDDYSKVWLYKASSQIALLAGEYPIEYLDHTISTGGNADARIIAFTRSVVVVMILKYDDKIGTSEIASTDVIARRSLTSMSIEGVSNAIKYSGENWPEAVRLTLGYGDETFVLPHRGNSRWKALELGAMVPSLTNDLNS